MISLNNISVSYGDNEVYKNFSFQFSEGVNVVVGKSGCGKTTLINVVANLVQYEGSCQTQGKAAVVFQQPCLSPVSVWKNVDLVLPKGADTQRVQQALELAQIAHKKQVNALQLSGGEQQRVALARAFAANRPVLLLDEPFEGLDYGTKKQLQNTLCEMLRQEEKTALLVTHDIDEALALADRIYLLHEKPCRLDLVAEVAPRGQRDEYSAEMLRQKAKIQQLLQ